MGGQIDGEEYGESARYADEEGFMNHVGILSGIANAAMKHKSERSWKGENGRPPSVAGALGSAMVALSPASYALPASFSYTAAPSVTSAMRLEVSWLALLMTALPFLSVW